MTVDPGDLGKLRVKKDLLWKPLLRGFRSYYRNNLKIDVNLQMMMGCAYDHTSYLEE